MFVIHACVKNRYHPLDHKVKLILIVCIIIAYFGVDIEFINLSDDRKGGTNMYIYVEYFCNTI